MTKQQRIAVSTAYKMALYPSSFPYVINNNTQEQNDMIVKTLEGLFDFDEEGNVIDFSTESMIKLNWIDSCPRKGVL